MGRGRKDLGDSVSRGVAGALRSRAGCGAPRARDVESRGAGEVQRRFWGCSGDRLREGLRRREDPG